MAKQLLTTLILATTLIFCSASVASDTDCAEMIDNALASDLKLSYKEFDQTRGQGFRRLDNKGCYKEAADLIEAYIAATKASQGSLIWHIAQLRAMHGDYEQALIYARKSVNPSEDLAKHPLRWNDYVHGVIAFLESDKKALILHRDHVAAGIDDYVGNKMNSNVLDSLIENFDQTYAYAANRVGK